MKYAFVFLFLTGLLSCDPDRQMGQVMGYAPVYASPQGANSITTVAAKPTVHAGKIYAYGNYLFQVEENEGIHIIDNTQPAQAHKIAFLQVPGCSELAIKSGNLYTNNINDLVVFDLTTIAAPQLVERLANAFPKLNQEYPNVTGAYFECPDPSKGIVVAWEEKMLNEPKCRR